MKDRFNDIVSDIKRKDFENRKRNDNAISASNSQMDFHKKWRSVYPINELGTSQNFVQHSINNLIALVGRIEEFYWDFYLADFIRDPKFTPTIDPLPDDDQQIFVLAAIVLSSACQKDIQGLRSKLNIDQDLMIAISNMHSYLFDLIKNVYGFVLPLTPPMTQVDLARVLGQKRYEINNQKRRQEWTTPDVDTGHNLKRWRNSDVDMQKRTLRAIREKMAELIWRP